MKTAKQRKKKIHSEIDEEDQDNDININVLNELETSSKQNKYRTAIIIFTVSFITGICVFILAMNILIINFY